MTYTTEKILANFLHNEDGLLSKKFIETATLLFGQAPAKRAFVEALAQGCYRYNRAEYFLENTLVVLPSLVDKNDHRALSTERAQVHEHLVERTGQWYPGNLDIVQRVDQGNNLFYIYKLTRFSHQNSPEERVDIPSLIMEHMRSSAQRLGGAPFRREDYWGFDHETYSSEAIRDTKNLLVSLLLETLYDSVTAQGYNKPADGDSLREYIMSLMSDNPLFNWPRWAGEGGIIGRDKGELMAFAS